MFVFLHLYNKSKDILKIFTKKGNSREKINKTTNKLSTKFVNGCFLMFNFSLSNVHWVFTPISNTIPSCL